MTVDGAVTGTFETVVSQGNITDAVQIEAKLGLMKVGVEITDPINPSKKDKYVAIQPQDTATNTPADDPDVKFKVETLYWLCDQKLPCQIPQFIEMIKAKVSMTTLNQVSKAIRQMKFKTHSMPDSNKEMIEKALVVQSQDPTISTLDSIVVIPFDQRITGKVALAMANAYSIKLKSYDKETILTAKSIPQADPKKVMDLAMA